jgi:release factor glutamine methyltransferase
VSKKPMSLLGRSISSAIREGTQQLHKAAVAEPRREAGSLLAHVLGHDRSFIIAHAEEPLTNEQSEALQLLVERRASGEPLQYITAQQEFFKLDFEVTPDVLIPRPETELIVETALALLQNDPETYFADIGTGSGCIAISMLHEKLQARAVAMDISRAALNVAQRNAERHKVTDRLVLLESDGLSALDTSESFSLIVSNPPYVSEAELKSIQREVSYEPPAALAAGPDGLSVIRRLLTDVPPFLRSGGYFIFEIGFGQSEAVERLVDRRVWKLLEIREDLQRIPRTFVLQGK